MLAHPLNQNVHDIFDKISNKHPKSRKNDPEFNDTNGHSIVAAFSGNWLLSRFRLTGINPFVNSLRAIHVNDE